MEILNFTDPNKVIYIVLTFILLNQLVSAFEMLYFYNKGHFNETGYFSWKILSLEYIFFQNQKKNNYINKIFRKEGMLISIIFKIICASILIISNYENKLTTTFCLFFLVIINLLYQIRFHYGGEGSDQMSLIIIISIFLGINMLANEKSKEYCIIFIAFQSVLSYSSAGIAKLVSKKWRSGEAIFDIFNTGSYGSKMVSIILTQYPKSCYFFSWGIIIFETLFPLVFLGNQYILAIFLLSGIVFHVLNAFFMGLNSFLLVFISTYPCIIYTSYYINSLY